MGSQISVVVTWSRRASKGCAALLRRVAQRVLQRLGVTDCEVGVLICGDEKIRLLNRTFRGCDEATDVLSFPAGEKPPDGPRYLGDIAISLDTARRQAAAAGVEECQQLVVLLVHGLLHLLGWDHERDQGEMFQLEKQLGEELGL